MPIRRKAPAVTLKTNPTIAHKVLWIIIIIPDNPMPNTAIHMQPLSKGMQKQILLKNLIVSNEVHGIMLGIMFFIGIMTGTMFLSDLKAKREN